MDQQEFRLVSNQRKQEMTEEHKLLHRVYWMSRMLALPVKPIPSVEIFESE